MRIYRYIKMDACMVSVWMREEEEVRKRDGIERETNESHILVSSSSFTTRDKTPITSSDDTSKDRYD